MRPSSELCCFGWRAVAWLAGASALSLLLTAPALAQQPQRGNARIGFVYPAGGQQGTTFIVTVGGQGLNNTSEADFTGNGIRARVVGYERPLTQKEFQELRDEAEKLQEKRKAAGGRRGPGWTAEDEKAAMELRQKMAVGPINRHPNPAISEKVVIEITLDADATPGTRDVRLKTPAGFTNPLAFVIGQLREFSAPLAKPEPMRPRAAANEPPAARKPGPPLAVTLPAVVNGQIMPGEVDRIRFSAKQGQRIVVAVAARALIPYLADAVPGWFQATLALHDAQDQELAYDDDFRFNPDPVLFYQIPRDGDYTIEIKDSIYRGRDDFVYRITVGELPFITSIFPLGGPASATTGVSLDGWNLPVAHIKVDGTAHSPGDFLISVRRNGILSSPVPFALETLPECLAVEPAGDATSTAVQPQAVTLPIIVNGRIDQPDDVDVFSFSGRAGAQIVAEVFARRLNSPLDSVLRITDAAGQQLATNDDNEDRSSGLTTHHADARIALTLPADGTYLVHLGDTQHQGGPDFGYRLHIGPPQPDFELRVVPSSLNVRGGATVPATVFALRKDGFAGEIHLGLKGGMSGMMLAGARVPPGQDKVRFTISVPAVLQDTTLTLAFEGHATIDGRSVVREALPAEDMMQAFAYRHLVPTQAMRVGISSRNPVRAQPLLLGKLPLRIPVGGTARLRVQMPAARWLENVEAELSEPPDGISISDSKVHGDTLEIVFAADAARLKPGLQANLIVQAFGVRPENPDKDKDKGKDKGTRRFPITFLPAIPFEIVAK